jgi:hypothetical protein
MTEVDWQDSTDLYLMLYHLTKHHLGRGRKMRLFAVACCRRIWQRLTDERSRAAILAAERYADGDCDELERSAAHRAAKTALLESEPGAHGDTAWALRGELVALSVAEDISAYLLMWLFNENAQRRNPTGVAGEKQAQAAILRDLVGPLRFRELKFARKWRSKAVIEIATAIYAKGAYDCLPELAIALRESGCDHSDVLEHCAGTGPHVRGCWVLDLLLAKG